MTMERGNIPELGIYNHQNAIAISASAINKLKLAGEKALPLVLELAVNEEAVLCHLEEVEVSLIDDKTIASLHLQFMNIAGATDVITFDHGEIHISVETAQRQAKEYAQDFEKELMLYIIHGLLHLAGYADGTESEFLRMEGLQQSILAQVW